MGRSFRIGSMAQGAPTASARPEKESIKNPVVSADPCVAQTMIPLRPRRSYISAGRETTVLATAAHSASALAGVTVDTQPLI
jgi:hypothetical protein